MNVPSGDQTGLKETESIRGTGRPPELSRPGGREPPQAVDSAPGGEIEQRGIGREARRRRTRRRERDPTHARLAGDSVRERHAPELDAGVRDRRDEAPWLSGYVGARRDRDEMLDTGRETVRCAFLDIHHIQPGPA